MYKKITVMSENDVRIAVNFVRSLAKSIQFSQVDIQKLMVTVSELTQNVVDHANGEGFIILETMNKHGVKITVKDCGSGIRQLNDILQGKRDFNRKGLGLGLLGAKRLMDEFIIETSKKGTKIIAIKWKDANGWKKILRDESTINRLAAVGQIAAGIAHEVRNPLTAVKGFLDLLKEKHPHEYIDIALSELDQALVTMQNLLNVAKPKMDNEPFANINITTELESVLYLFQNQQYRIEVKTEFRDTNVQIIGKKNQIKRALFNLIKNAFEAIRDEGVIIVRHFRKKDRLFISISDTGVGIPEDKINILGTPFYTSKETGTGMGLAQVFATVYDHDGKVHVQSEVNVGTIFTLEFPILESTEIGVEDLNLTYKEGQNFSEFFEVNKQRFINILQSQAQDIFNHIQSVEVIDEEYINEHLRKIVRLLNEFDEFGLVMHAKESGKHWAKYELDLILKLEWFQSIRKVYWDFLYNYYEHKGITQKDLFELERKVNHNIDSLIKHFAASYTEYKDYLINAQNELIEDLNVPIIPLTDSMAVLPVVGTVDTKRARCIQQNVLEQIYQNNIKRIIIDLSGVTYMDTAVLGHLFNIISGIRIQGCKATLTGVRPEITNTIVELGIELHEKVDTMGTLKQAIHMYSKEFDVIESRGQ